MAVGTGATSSASANAQASTYHSRMAQLLHDHATWAAIAMLVVLVAKYIFNLPLTQDEVLAFLGILASALFGARWAEVAHINALRALHSAPPPSGGQSPPQA